MSEKLQLKNKRYGSLLVIDKSDNKNEYRRVSWICKCDCGKIITVEGRKLVYGVTKSCGCIDYGNTKLIGKKYGKLTVIKDSLKRCKSKNVIWECLCECGKKLFFTQYQLNTLNKNYGCYDCRPKNKRSMTHNMSKTSEFHTWKGMLQRCNNQNDKNYHNYGGRGIKVCDRWLNSFENFFSDMGKKPSRKHSVDRYPNNDGNYEPSNCRWATNPEQCRNKRTNVYLECNGINLIVADWATRWNICPGSISKPLIKGVSFDALYKKYEPLNR